MHVQRSIVQHDYIALRKVVLETGCARHELHHRTVHCFAHSMAAGHAGAQTQPQRRQQLGHHTLHGTAICLAASHVDKQAPGCKQASG